MDFACAAMDGYHRVTGRGLRTLDGVVAMMERIKALDAESGCQRYLFDLRETREGFSLDDKYRLGLYLADTFGSRFALVVLLRKEQITGFLENVSVNRGLTRFRILADEPQAVELVKTL